MGEGEVEEEGGACHYESCRHTHTHGYHLPDIFTKGRQTQTDRHTHTHIHRPGQHACEFSLQTQVNKFKLLISKLL